MCACYSYNLTLKIPQGNGWDLSPCLVNGSYLQLQKNPQTKPKQKPPETCLFSSCKYLHTRDSVDVKFFGTFIIFVGYSHYIFFCLFGAL